jgi:hypothetical protein
MLNPDKALELARKLTVLSGFPNYSEAIEATGEDLVFLTENSPDPDVAEARARWLVTEIRRTWPRWSGTSDLMTLYRKRFNPPREVKAEDNEAKNYGAKPTIRCEQCGDTGCKPDPQNPGRYRWCDCETGILLHFDLPDWLDLLNRETAAGNLVNYKANLTDFNQHPAAEKPVNDEIQRSITTSVDACAGCKDRLHRSHTHQEYWQHHTRQDMTA